MARAFAGGLLLGLQALRAWSSCSHLGDCGSCVNHTASESEAPGCYWCEIDQKCHSVGGAASPCTPEGADDACISESPSSRCRLTGSLSCRGDDDPKKARQVHLSLAGPGAMRVAWKTLGEKPVAIEVVVSTNMSHERGRSVMVERSGQYLPGHGHHHVAKLAGLEPGETYQYRIVCDGVTTAYRTFKAVGNERDASFLVIGDMGWGGHGHAVQSRHRIEALKAKVDAVLHVGDISYADNAPLREHCAKEFCYEKVWDGYMDWLENVTDSRPYMVAVGNHETECHSQYCESSPEVRGRLSNFSAYNFRWAMPSAESGGAASMWYSFDYGPAHFVVLNTETDFPDAPEEHHGSGGGGHLPGLPSGHFAPDGEYLRWLEADLAAAARNREAEARPWIVALGHRPWLAKSGEARDVAVRAAHAPLFEKYGVDLFLAGHIHSYHRLLPTATNPNVTTATIVTGGAGCDEFANDQRSTWLWDKRGNNSLWDFRYFNKDTQVGMLKISAEELTFTAIASSTGEAFDSITLRARGELALYV